MRKINEIIIHCTATPEGRDVSVEEIRNLHLKRGFNDIGYHYVIGLNGTIHEGRSLDKVGAHCKGRNLNSIGIVYVGGLSEDMQPKDTRTFAQITSMVFLVKFLLDFFPTITKVSAHYMYSNKACPCFDVEKEYKDLIPINHDKEN